MKKLLALLLAMAMVVALAACGGSKTETKETGSASEGGDTFRIGVFEPLSGGNAAYGQEARNGIELGVKYVNENGGFNGKQGETIVYDTQCSVEEAVKVANKLINEDKVDVIIGSMMSSEMFATGQALNEAGVYTIGLGTSASWMKEDWPYVFRCAMNNGNAAPSTADLVLDMGLTSVGVFYGQDDAALSTYQEFEKACQDKNITITDAESYDQGDTDFSAQITNIINSGCEAVYISVIGETAPVLVKQLRQYGYKGIILDKESFMFSQIAIAGEENSNYVAFVNPYVTYESVDDIENALVKDFAERYAAEYGEINKTDSSYRGWDAITVLAKACEIAGAYDADSLKEATNKISGLEGLGGTIDFTSGDREGYHDYNSWILVDGKNQLWADWLSSSFEAFKASIQ